MKVLITGGSGSLGKSVIENFSANFPKAQIESPKRSVLDLQNKIETFEYIDNFKPTHVVHLAAKVLGIKGHLSKPQDSFFANSEMDLNLFSALSVNPPEWLFYASTVAGYGYPFQSIPIQEKFFLEGQPHSSEYGYAQAKRFGLTHVRLMQRLHGTKIVYGILTNLFGLNDRYLAGNGHVLISLATKALIAKSENKTLEIWGTPKTTRDFISVESASKIITELVDKDLDVINIASGVEITIGQLAALTSEVFNLEKGYFFTGELEGVNQRVSDITKLQKVSASSINLDSFSEIRIFLEKFLI
jgi:GDP-L-fucose synthase